LVNHQLIQQSICKHVAPHGHIIQILSQPIFYSVILRY